MEISRRGFLATAAAAAGGAFADNPVRPNLTLGVLSDIHIHTQEQVPVFEKALAFFRDAGVDGVVIAGDMADTGLVHQLEKVAAAWFKVFPDNKAPDGRTVEKLFVYGNHDVSDYADGELKSKGLDPKDWPAHKLVTDRKANWERILREPWQGVYAKQVKGYVFVGAHWGYEKQLDAFLQANADRLGLRNGKPFFYAQHEQLDDTVNATWLIRGAKWDNGQIPSVTRDCLSKYPNCIAFSGHSHNSLTDERSIWQGAFTAVNCSCARGYAFTPPGRENGFACPDFNRTPPFEMDKFDHQSVRQGMVMEVFADRITFAKREFTYDQVLADDWVVPLYAGGAAVPPTGTPKYDFKTRAAAAKAPVFAKGAKVSVAYVKEGYRRTVAGMGGLDRKNPHPQLKVAFPPITRKGSPSRAFEFRVVCEAQDADMVRVVEERRVFSPNAYQAETRDVAPCSCNFPVSNLQTSGVIRFVVFPIDCWGNEGAPVKSAWKNLKAWCADGGR